MRLQLVPPSERRRGVSGLLAAMRRSCRSHRAATSPFHPPAALMEGGREGGDETRKVFSKYAYVREIWISVAYSFLTLLTPLGVCPGRPSASAEGTARGRDN